MELLRRYTLDGYCYHVSTATRGRRPIFRSGPAAKVLVDAIQFLRAERAFVLAYVVMPDHFHLLVQPRDGWDISEVVKSVKGSRVLNEWAGRRGPLWQRSFFDRVIRNEEQLAQCIEYIHFNPVKARLVAAPEQFAWSSASPGGQTDLEIFVSGSDVVP